MANLILLKGKQKPIHMREIKVRPEEEIEKIIFEKEILPDVFLLKRQLQTSTNKERIDIVGIDNENNILVIEIKDETVDENVITQVTKYVEWVETNPDAIKNIYLELKDKDKNKTKDLIFDWEKEPSVKVLIIGPYFKPSIKNMIKRVDYTIELIEFKRFKEEGSRNDYIFLNNLIIEEKKAARPVSTIREYDEKFYKQKHYNPNSVKEFWKLSNELEKYIKTKGWNLTRKNNKGYVAFKYGSREVFGVTFSGTKSFCLFFKIPRETAQKIKGFEMFRYEERWKRALYKVESGAIDIKRFEPLFKVAYKNIVGEK